MKHVLRVMLLGLITVSGCSCNSAVGWGDHVAELVQDGTSVAVEGSVTISPETNKDHHIELCEVRALSFGIRKRGLRTATQVGDLTAFHARLDQPLCNQGKIEVRSGHLEFYGHPRPGDPATTSIPSDEWEVVGFVRVDFTKDHEPPPLEEGDEALSESAGGIFSLIATNGAGEEITLDGSFKFEITWRVYEFEP